MLLVLLRVRRGCVRVVGRRVMGLKGKRRGSIGGRGRVFDDDRPSLFQRRRSPRKGRFLRGRRWVGVVRARRLSCRVGLQKREKEGESDQLEVSSLFFQDSSFVPFFLPFHHPLFVYLYTPDTALLPLPPRSPSLPLFREGGTSSDERWLGDGWRGRGRGKEPSSKGSRRLTTSLVGIDPPAGL
ncbi:hypothetical protein BDY24DRAFT_394263 [Mrakia frigida]|uniref:uncharacterized protein n=1 Tax=Mrakia frigida TaxID=29902 RepID=UPI003FCC1D38